MKRLLLLVCLLLGLSSFLPVFSQTMDEEMVNAQLRFIKENARLTKREYQRFAKIYLEYNKQLYELNKNVMQRPHDTNNHGNDPFFGGIPFGQGIDNGNNGQPNEYMKRWNEINSSYIQKLEKNLPDSTREKIGIAQWELGQRIWKQWAEQNQKMIEQQLQDMRNRSEHIWYQMSQQREHWWNNYWRSWPSSEGLNNNDSVPQNRNYNSAPNWNNGQDFRQRFWNEGSVPMNNWGVPPTR